MISRSMRRPVDDAIDCAGVTSASRRMPSGVNSYSHENTSAGTKPSASNATSVLSTHAGVPKIGSRVSATCTTSQAPTRYSPAMRTTFRRWSSA